MENLEEQDVNECVKPLREIATLFNWSEQEGVMALRALIDKEYHYLIIEAANAENAIMKLLENAYLPRRSFRYYSQLEKIFQENYRNMYEYRLAVFKICEKLGLCKRWTEEQIRSKMEQAFFSRLNLKTKIELAKLQVRGVEEAIQIIEDTQEVIRSAKQEHGMITKHNGRQKRPNRFASNHRNRLFNQNFEHGNREFENKNLNLKDKNYFVASPKTKIFYAKGFCSEKEITCMFDSGADRNYIARRFAKELGLKIKPTDSRRIQIADGRNLEINKKVEIKIKLEQLKNVDFKIKAEVLPTKESEIILGTSFLKENKCIIDFKEEKLTIMEWKLKQKIKILLSRLKT